MLNIFKLNVYQSIDNSKLFNEETFYSAFMNDIEKCKRELIIECPFIYHKRMNALYPSFRRLTKRGVRVVINTRHPSEHEPAMMVFARKAISGLQDMGVIILYTGNHHRKLAILDSQILYEGSLNILSENDSCEIMRRIDSVIVAEKMLSFIKVNEYLE
jgi:hypothetical protein